MTYAPPTEEQLFALQHAAGIDAIAAHDRFSEASHDLVEAIVTGVGEFAAAEYAPLNRVGDLTPPRWADGAVTMPPGFRDAYQAAVAAGWGSIDGPVDHGGQGLPFTLAAGVGEALGTAAMGFTLINILTPGAIHALEALGTPDQNARCLPKLVSGEWNGTMNLTEPQAGSDVGALRTQATPAGDGSWRIAGTKIFITFGEHDLTDNIVHLVLARTPGAPAGTKGISLFLVPKFRLDAAGAPTIPNGVKCVGIEHKLGIHSSPTCIMAYGEDGDSLGELIGQVGGGMRAMFVMMNNARLMVGNQGVQIAEAATQHAQAYAADRIQSARASDPEAGPVAIIEHPDVRRMLLRMKALTQGARALVYYAAGQLDRGTLGDAAAEARCDVLIPLAKAWATDMGCEVASLGVQIHGGMGFVEETGAAQFYRDARIAPIYEGTNGIQAADLVGRKLTMGNGQPLDGLIADIQAGARGEPRLAELADACAEVTAWMRAASVDDRLAGSVDYLAMLATATAGWQLARQRRIAGDLLAAGEGDPAFLNAKCAVARFFLNRIVPEALGRKAGAMAGAADLYDLSVAELVG